MRRRPFRFSLLDMLRAVMLVAICCAMLRHDLPLLASFVFTLTISTLCFAAVGAICGRDGQRVFWTGFAVFGWVHIFLAFYEWRDSYTDPATDWLFTSKLLYWFANQIEVRMDYWSDYWRIGHSVLTLIVAFAGATVTRLAFSLPRHGDGKKMRNRM